jgi:hypothetical protein
MMVTWHDGGRKPDKPEALREGDRVPDNGSLLIGDKGVMVVKCHSDFHLSPAASQQQFEQPQAHLPRVEAGDHKRDWLNAIKTGGATGCDVTGYDGQLNETVLLGNLAVLSGQRLNWQPEVMKVPNAPELSNTCGANTARAGT